MQLERYGMRCFAAKQPRSLTAARLGVGACLWDGAFVLTAYLLTQPSGTFTGKHRPLAMQLLRQIAVLCTPPMCQLHSLDQFTFHIKAMPMV